MVKTFLKKKFILTLVVITTFIGAASMLDVRAETIDTTSCDGDLLTYYRDADGDGYGDLGETILACSLPVGYSEDSSDCDDDNVDINPGETEICDEFDNNCDGNINEGIATSTYYLDLDGDGYGLTASSVVYCMISENYAEQDGDCNDEDENINPGETEICDGVDNNCDGEIDEGVKTVFYLDADGDGYGDSSSTTLACSLSAGYSVTGDDCDDDNADINPGAQEVDDDGIDNNCDGKIDESATPETYVYYRDADGDGYGDGAVSVEAASQPDGYVSNSDDCDDTEVDVNPGETELCDGVDNNCDREIDEGVKTIFYLDADGDGYGDSSNTILACSLPDGYVNTGGDCNDDNGNVNPGVNEINNDGIDNNCDGNIDEGCGDNCNDNCDCVCSCTCSCPCNGNNGNYVSCMAQFTNCLKKNGEITGREKGQIMREAAKEINEMVRQKFNNGSKNKNK